MDKKIAKEAGLKDMGWMGSKSYIDQKLEVLFISAVFSAQSPAAAPLAVISTGSQSLLHVDGGPAPRPPPPRDLSARAHAARVERVYCHARILSNSSLLCPSLARSRCRLRSYPPHTQTCRSQALHCDPTNFMCTGTKAEKKEALKMIEQIQRSITGDAKEVKAYAWKQEHALPPAPKM
jgi:hypothetical protein